MNLDFLSGGHYDVFGAFWVTVQLTFWAALGSLVWGTVLAAMRVSPVKPMRVFGTIYVNVFRNTPLTLIIVGMSLVVSNELGLALADRSSMSFIKDNNFRLAVLGFVIYTATFVCEAVRSGINTVPTGQAEAARALGLRFTQVLVIVVLPQALRSVIGPLASVLIALTKNTTVASTIGVSEAALLMSDMIENESNALMSVFALFALGFVALTLPTGLLLGWLARRAGVRR
jgi:glutamate transport system permease protein